jgi:hypothetical protein
VAPAGGRGRGGSRGGVGGGEGGGVAVRGGCAHGLRGEGFLRRGGRAHWLRVAVLEGRLRLGLPAVRHRGRGGGTVGLRRGRWARMFYSGDVMRSGVDWNFGFGLDTRRNTNLQGFPTESKKLLTDCTRLSHTMSWLLEYMNLK